MISLNWHSANDSTLAGQFSPVASTGMSSYRSKLMPVLITSNSSLSRMNGLVNTCRLMVD